MILHPRYALTLPGRAVAKVVVVVHLLVEAVGSPVRSGTGAQWRVRGPTVAPRPSWAPLPAAGRGRACERSRCPGRVAGTRCRVEPGTFLADDMADDMKEHSVSVQPIHRLDRHHPGRTAAHAEER